MKKLLATLLALLLALSAPVLAEEMLLEALETSAVDGDTPISPAEEAPVAEEETDLVDEIEVSESFAVADAPADVETVTVTDKQALSLNVGETRKLAVEGKTIKSCKSSKKSVASVSKAGLVTAKKVGKAKIVVKTHNGKKASIKVTVTKAAPNPSGRTEMSAFFGQNLEKTAKKFNLGWSNKNSPTGYYTNKVIPRN